MTQLVTTDGPRALAIPEDELIATLRNALYPGAADNSIRMVISWCKATGKDPMKRPVHLVPMRVKKVGGGRDDYEWRDVVMPGIVDYRTDAARTGQHAGNDEAVFGPDVTQSLGGVQITFPEWCEFSVYRLVDGQARKFSSGRVRWLETYATAKSDTLAPNAMWKKRPYGQLEKCAEALALRRAFPEVGAQPTAEEMEGRETFEVLDGDGAAAAAPAPAFNVQRKPHKAAPTPAPAAPAAAPNADDVTDATITKETTRTPAPAPAAPPASEGQGGGDLIGPGEQAYLKNKARAAGVDLNAMLAEAGGLVLDKLTKGDFQALKSKLMAM